MTEIDRTLAIETLADCVDRLTTAVLELTEALADTIVDADRPPTDREQKVIADATRTTVDAAARISEAHS